MHPAQRGPALSVTQAQLLQSLGLDADALARTAKTQPLNRLEQILEQIESQLEYAQMTRTQNMPPQALQSYGMAPPSTAFGYQQPYLSPSYYQGPSPYGSAPQMQDPMANMTQALQMLQAAQQGVGGGGGQGFMPPQMPPWMMPPGGMMPPGPGMLPGAMMPPGPGMLPGATMPPGPGFAPPGLPGGPFGGSMGLDNDPPPPVWDPTTDKDGSTWRHQMDAWQKAKALKAIDDFNEKITTWTNTSKAFHNMNMSIIGNIGH